MSDLRKAAQQVLDTWDTDDWFDSDALRAFLAQPEQEPVAWRWDQATYGPDDLRGRQWQFNTFSPSKPYTGNNMVQNLTPLFAAPPQRKPLTEDEIAEIALHGLRASTSWNVGFARDIEAAHGIGGES